jgi:hypothetical protein
MPPLNYSSTASPDDAVSTEGITFTLDGVTFACHGRISIFDLSEFAGPAADAGEDSTDPDVVRMLADLMRMVLGADTYRLVTKHRRAHQTPDAIMQQIVMDVVGAVNGGRPSARPSPSPAGEPAPARSAAVSPSPASPPASWPPQDVRAPASPAWTPPDPRAPVTPLAPAVLAALASTGDITFAAPPAAATPRDPLAVKKPARIRRLSLAHPERGVQVEDQTG